MCLSIIRQNQMIYMADWIKFKSELGGAKSGKAYMFQHAMNVVLGPKYDKQLITGGYTIAGIFCSKCGEELGWKYVQAYDMKNRFKEGKFILEEIKMFQKY
ncbi:hypothetical protein V6N13_086257 [Hibiscus sabdariffa]